jgi:hypothetical protein
MLPFVAADSWASEGVEAEVKQKYSIMTFQSYRKRWLMPIAKRFAPSLFGPGFPYLSLKQLPSFIQTIHLEVDGGS